MHDVNDRLWSSHRAELDQAVRRLGLLNAPGVTLSDLQQTRDSLDDLGEKTRLQRRFEVIERDLPGGRTVRQVAYMINPWQASVLEDQFGRPGTINGLPPARYLGRKLCELTGLIDARSAAIA